MHNYMSPDDGAGIKDVPVPSSKQGVQWSHVASDHSMKMSYSRGGHTRSWKCSEVRGINCRSVSDASFLGTLNNRQSSKVTVLINSNIDHFRCILSLRYSYIFEIYTRKTDILNTRYDPF
jgi:hypothetical protein